MLNVLAVLIALGQLSTAEPGRNPNDTFGATQTGNQYVPHVQISDGVNPISVTNPLPTSAVAANQGFVSIVNSSTTPLTGAATFTGTSEEVTNYSQLTVLYETDVEGTISMELSTDGTNWDRKKVVTNASSGVHTLVIVSKYFRIVFTNGVDAQSYFRLQTIYHVSKGKHLTSTTNQTISENDDVELIRSVSNPMLDLSRGLHTGLEYVRGFALNDSIGTTEEIISPQGGTYIFPTIARTLRIAAGGDANDTAAGTGAREITLYGLDENWEEAIESLITAGASASNYSTITFIRLNSATVSQVGTYGGANTDDITIESNTDAYTLAVIQDDLGRSVTGIYSTPVGSTTYLNRVSAFVDSNKTCTIQFWKRENADDISAPFSPKVLLVKFPALTGEGTYRLTAFESAGPKSDIYLTGQTSSGTVSVDVEFDMVKVRN